MKNKTSIGTNRTGMLASPQSSEEMIRATELFPPTSVGTPEAASRVRALYVAHATTFGTMPPPESLAEASVAALQALKGNKAVVLMDKLANRLAFERTGSRLYEALTARIAGGPSWDGGPTADEVSAIYSEELRHFQLVKRYIEQLGGDPTLVSPSADVSAVASLGLIQVLGDPRIPLHYALHGILVAELTDTEGWATLIDIAATFGQDEMAEDFRRAHAVEEEHLTRVRDWIHAAVIADANMELEEEPGEQEETLGGVSLH